MKKILIVMINLYNGGAERSLINLLNEMDYKKYKVDLLLFQKKGLFLDRVPSEVNILEQPDDIRLLYNWPCLKDFFSIRKLKYIFYRYYYNLLVRIKYKKHPLRAKKQVRWVSYYKNIVKQYNKEYDVSISYLNNDSMQYVIDKTIAAKKYIWIHNDYKKIGCIKEYDEEYMKKADKIVTISNDCLKSFVDVFPYTKDKCIYIPNLSSKKIIMDLAKKPSEYKFDDDKFKILSIGRLSYVKGFDLAIEAAKILKDANVNFQWYVIGSGSMKKQLEDMIRKYSLEEQFRLIGVTKNPYSYMAKCDIVAQTSRAEGKSMVLDEAKILNKTFVVTKYSTVNDQADESISVMVDIDAEAIAKGIQELYNNRNKIKKLEAEIKKHEYENVKDIAKYYELFGE